MKLIQFLLACTAVTYALTLKGRRTSCSTPNGSGTCQSESTCSGFSVEGYCPDTAGAECCIVTSCPSGREGLCRNTTSASSLSKYDAGFYLQGHCPGNADIQCFIAATSKAPPPPPPTKTTKPPPPPTTKPTTTSKPTTTPAPGSCQDLAALDISAKQSSTFWTCAKKTYSKAVIRGYQQACKTGGGVDSGFTSSYNAAKAAGFTNFDAYMFPCAGTPRAGCGYPACKSAAQQVSEFEAAVAASGMTPGHLWLDLEPATASSCATCNAWNLGASGNVALAKEFITAISGSSYNWGVYANGNQWADMFGSRSLDLASSLPLWAVQQDQKPGVSSVTTFMGGWTQAFAKQYSLDTSVCGGTKNADLDSFCG